MRDKHDALFEEQAGYPSCGTNRLPFLMDKHDTLFEGQTGSFECLFLEGASLVTYHFEQQKHQFEYILLGYTVKPF